jgi:hypothetical protein
MIDFLQLVVLILLLFTLFFGLGFIINMLMKTTWFPVYGYVVFVIGFLYFSWGTDLVVSNIKSYTVSDYIPFLSGLGGALLSGFTIKTLRVKGYKMF